MLGVAPEQIKINDLAVNPLSGNVYLSIAKSAEGDAGIVSINDKGDINELDLSNVWFSKAELADAPEDRVVGGRVSRRRNWRGESITDLAFVEGNVIVSGMTNRSSTSGVRSMAFPFGEQTNAGSIEIYHAAHGRSEDNAAIRTFVPFVIEGKPNVLAGFDAHAFSSFSAGWPERAGEAQGNHGRRTGES